MFKVGDKVICVDDTCPPSPFDYLIPPVKYKEYIVLGMRGKFSDITIDHPQPSGKDVAWKQSRFRKVDDNFADGVLENIKEQIEQEELVKT